jgi:hypothetical protein
VTKGPLERKYRLDSQASRVLKKISRFVTLREVLEKGRNRDEDRQNVRKDRLVNHLLLLCALCGRELQATVTRGTLMAAPEERCSSFQ